MVKALRAVRKTRGRVVNRFGDVRNNAIAHRTVDSLAQYDLIRNLQANDALPLVAEFYDAVHLFVRALPDVMLAAGCSSAILKQMIEKGAKLPGLK